MPELRKDTICGRWVIISTNRGKRPSDFGSTVEQNSRAFARFAQAMKRRLRRKF